jgi:ABC-type transport system involved in multi-copper enzyme maturation permease subunit
MRTLLRRDIASSRFLACVALALLVLLYAQEPGARGDARIDPVIKLLMFPVSFNNAMGLVALAAGVCSAANYAQEKNTRFLRPILARVPLRRYLAGRYASACLSTGLALLVAFALFTLVCAYESNGQLDLADSSQGVSTLVMMSWMGDGSYHLWFAGMGIIVFLYGAVLAGIGTAVTAFLPHRYVGYTAAFIVAFFWMRVCSSLGLPVWVNPMALSKCLADVGWAPLTLLCYCAAFLAMTALAFCVFLAKAGSEVRNGG